MKIPKVLKQIQADLLHGKRATLEPLLVPELLTTVEIQEMKTPPYQTEFQIGTKWMYTGYCEAKHLELMKEKYINEMRWILYGEFYHPLLKLDRLLHAREYDEARKEVEELLSLIVG